MLSFRMEDIKFKPLNLLSDDTLCKLKALIPSAFVDGQINFDVLKASLGGSIENHDKEAYGLNWAGKKNAINTCSVPSVGTLRPCPSDSESFDETNNLFIEGDNLEVLKLLQNSYANKVKLIYIDPPYNTGNDFVYDDSFSDNLSNYLKKTGQVESDGAKLTTNIESGGRYHTNWLNMIYPRLKLARNLLSDDGAIFISIDDHEVANLKTVCDEIFGEDCFVALIPWRKRIVQGKVPFGISQDYESVVVYAKKDFMAGRSIDRKYYTTPDFPNRPWRLNPMTKQCNEHDRPNSAFTIINPKNGDEFPHTPNRVWCVTKESIKKHIAEDRIVFPGDYDFLNLTKPGFRKWKDEDGGQASVSTVIPEPINSELPSDVGMSQDGNKDIVELFGPKVFSFPKPVSLIKHFLSISNLSGVQEFRSSGVQEFRSSGVQEFRSSGVQEFRFTRVHRPRLLRRFRNDRSCSNAIQC